MAPRLLLAAAVLPLLAPPALADAPAAKSCALTTPLAQLDCLDAGLDPLAASCVRNADSRFHCAAAPLADLRVHDWTTPWTLSATLAVEARTGDDFNGTVTPICGSEIARGPIAPSGMVGWSADLEGL